jgi:hypothetical protein
MFMTVAGDEQPRATRRSVALPETSFKFNRLLAGSTHAASARTYAVNENNPTLQ